MDLLAPPAAAVDDVAPKRRVKAEAVSDAPAADVAATAEVKPKKEKKPKKEEEEAAQQSQQEEKKVEKEVGAAGKPHRRKSLTPSKVEKLMKGSGGKQGKAAAAEEEAKGGSGAVEKKIRKPHRWRPGTVALREIRKYQKSTELLCRKAPMYRLIREIAQKYGSNEGVRFTKIALMALHESAEEYLVDTFELGYLMALHAKRVTISPQDIKLARHARGDADLDHVPTPMREATKAN